VNRLAKGEIARRTIIPALNDTRSFAVHGFAASAVLAIAIAIAVAFAGAAAAQSGAVVAGSAPGKAGIAETLKITGTIAAIDKATRDVTLKGPQGGEITVTAGPDVKNFDSLKVGDQVALQYVEALTLELKKGGGLVVQRTEAAAGAAAKPGERPAGAVGRQVTIVADVVAVDAAKQMVTLRGPQRTVELRIRDAEQFKRIAKGDQVEATFTQAVALAVEPAAKK
jgi:Cu/Ag efflux protein CusF